MNFESMRGYSRKWNGVRVVADAEPYDRDETMPYPAAWIPVNIYLDKGTGILKKIGEVTVCASRNVDTYDFSSYVDVSVHGEKEVFPTSTVMQSLVHYAVDDMAAKYGSYIAESLS